MFSFSLSKVSAKKAFVFVYHFFSSVRLAFFLLFSLFVLTFFGTLYQVDYGLYAAQHRYFYSWFLLLGGVFPLPAAKLLLTLLSFNLLFAAYKRYRFRVPKLGIVMIHYGLIFLLVGSFLGHLDSQESFVSLGEGESTTFSEDYYQSEIVVWQEKPDGEMVLQEGQSFDTEHLTKGGKNQGNTPIIFDDFGIVLRPIYFYENAAPSNIFQDGIESVSGIKMLDYRPLPKKRENAFSGGLFELSADFLLDKKKVLLWESEGAPYVLKKGKNVYYIEIRRKRYPLPFELKLNNFKRELYYASDIPKEFESQVSVIKEGLAALPARIYMNNPLRMDGLTMYQASFSMTQDGAKRSILAVVQYPGFFVPYIASIVIALGMFYHFIYMMVARRKKS